MSRKPAPRPQQRRTCRAVLAEPLEGRRLFAVISGFIESEAVEQMDDPTAMVFAPDGRLFVAEQGGAVRIVDADGQLLPQPFFTVTTDPTGERGLIGITLDPAFETNGFVYIYHTVPGQPGSTLHNRVARLTADGDVAQGGSLTTLFELDPLSTANNHNGGAMHFGPDGKLYVAVGDNANPPQSQSMSTTHGKMLRLNPDGSVPSDNPFLAQTGGKDQAIWALGLRNPYTFAFQPGTGRMFINDVGQNTWEEINEGVAGANYGWPGIEGEREGESLPAVGTYVDPLHVYPNDENADAITGGAFYNPPAGAANAFPADYVGDYFFADIGGEFVRRLDPATGQEFAFATDIRRPVDVAVGPDGSLYVLTNSENNGIVTRFRAAQGPAPEAPAIDRQPADVTAPVGGSATFDVAASGSAPLSYQWQRNGQNIAGATAATYTLQNVAAAGDGDTFRVVVTNAAGTATSDAATLTVTQNQPPDATITSPAAGATFVAGTTITYAGEAADPQDGVLPDSAFSWRVDYHTGNVVRPFVPTTTGVRGGSFAVPTTTPYTLPDVFYRVHLTVTDSDGLTHSVSRDIAPVTAATTLQTTPAGLSLTLDGQPVTTPSTVTSVAGLQRELGAPETQTLGGVNYRFVSWSDQGARVHTIGAPEQNTTYTATYEPVAAPQPPVELAAAADAVVQDGRRSDRNFGRVRQLQAAAGDRQGTSRESLLTFDLTTIQSVTGAKLVVFGRLSRGQTARIGAFDVADTSWTETGLTYDNRPAAGAEPVATVTATRGPRRRYEFDLTAYLQAQKAAGRNTVSLSIRGLDAGREAFAFPSRESRRDTPRLVVTR